MERSAVVIAVEGLEWSGRRKGGMGGYWKGTAEERQECSVCTMSSNAGEDVRGGDYFLT